MAKTTYTPYDLSHFREGIEVIVDDDSVGTVDLSRLTDSTSGIIYVGTAKDAPFPNHGFHAFFYFDIGGSAVAYKLNDSGSPFSSSVSIVVNTTLTGTTGVDGNITINISNNSSILTIEQRAGSASYPFLAKVIA